MQFYNLHYLICLPCVLPAWCIWKTKLLFRCFSMPYVTVWSSLNDLHPEGLFQNDLIRMDHETGFLSETANSSSLRRILNWNTRVCNDVWLPHKDLHFLSLFCFGNDITLICKLSGKLGDPAVRTVNFALCTEENGAALQAGYSSTRHYYSKSAVWEADVVGIPACSITR